MSLDPSTFENPVPVGSVLYLTAMVSYTDPSSSSASEDGVDDQISRSDHQTRVQVRVESKVRDVEHGETKPTGQFNYTFLVDKDVRVMPRTYSEFMIWVDARRRAEHVVAALEKNKTGDQVGADASSGGGAGAGVDGGDEVALDGATRVTSPGPEGEALVTTK